MNAPRSRAPLTAPHVTTGELCRWKAISFKVGCNVGLDFYDLRIEEALKPPVEYFAQEQKSRTVTGGSAPLRSWNKEVSRHETINFFFT